MPTIIEGPTGRRFQFESDIPEARAFELAKQQHPEFFPEEIKAPAPARPDPGITSEIGSILKSGAGQGIAGLGKLGQYAGIGGKGLEEYGAGITQRATEALSPGTQAALQRQFLAPAPEGKGFFGYQLGDAKLTDIPAQALQTIPVMAGTMAAAAGATLLAPASAVTGVGAGVLGVLGRVGLGKVAGRIATAAGPGAGAAETLAGKLAINTLAGNVGEGLAAAGISGIETEKAINDFAKLNPDGFFQSPIGQQALQDADGDKKKAIELGAFRAGRSVAALTGLSTAVLATPGSTFEALAVFGKGAKAGRLRNAIIGGVTEGPGQELPQGSAEQYIQNLQRIQAGEPISPGKGVLEAGVQGAIIGTPIGGALGAITGSGKAQEPPPLDAQFRELADQYQKKGLNATDAYRTAATDIEKYAQPGATLTVYDSLGDEKDVTVVGKNDAGKTVVNFSGENFVLGKEFTVSDPKDGRYGFKKGNAFVDLSEITKDEVEAELGNIKTVIDQFETEFAQTKVKTPEHYEAERQGTFLDATEKVIVETPTEERDRLIKENSALRAAPAATPTAQTVTPAPAAPAPPAAAPASPAAQTVTPTAPKPSVTPAAYPLIIMRQEDDPNPFPTGMNFAVGNGVSDAMEYFKTAKEAETYRKDQQEFLDGQAAAQTVAESSASPIKQATAQTVSVEQQSAIDLIDAVDKGGIPLNPAKVNAIARGLGLEVTKKSKPEETIQRIRDAVGRITPTEQTPDLQASIYAASAARQRATPEQEATQDLAIKEFLNSLSGQRATPEQEATQEESVEIDENAIDAEAEVEAAEQDKADAVAVAAEDTATTLAKSTKAEEKAAAKAAKKAENDAVKAAEKTRLKIYNPLNNALDELDLMNPDEGTRDDPNPERAQIKSGLLKLAKKLVDLGYMHKDDLSTFSKGIKSKDVDLTDSIDTIRMEVESAVGKESTPQSRVSAKQSLAPKKASKGKNTSQQALRQLLTKMREARSQEYYAKALPRVTALIYKRMNQMGLGKYVSNEFLASMKNGDNLEVNGEYIKRLINLAIAGKSDKQIMSTLDHEAIHAMRAIGMITKDEWKNLSNLVDKRGWLKTFLIDYRYDKTLDPTEADLKISGLTREAWIKDAKYEEAIADAFSTYANGRSPVLRYDENNQAVYRYKKDLKLAGQPVGIINRILRILRIVKEVASEDAVFKRLESAPIEADADKLKAETSSPKLSVAKANQKASFYKDLLPASGFNRLPIDSQRTYKDKSGQSFLTFERDGVRVAFSSGQKLYSDKRGVGVYQGDTNESVFHALIVDPQERKKGKATNALTDIIRSADESNTNIYLQPASLDVGAMTTSQLVEFYKRFGFEPQNNDKVLIRVANLEKQSSKLSVAKDNQKFSVAPRINTDAFKRWFGDSKVVDENGDPLVVYHGTPYTFVSGAETGIFNTKDFGALLGKGAYFTRNATEAQDYAGKLEARNSKPNIIPAYVSIKNPFIATSVLNKVPKRNELEQQGYDGVILKENGKVRWAVAFQPTQIKSSIGNTGAFDPTNPDIRRSVAPSITEKEIKKLRSEKLSSEEDGNLANDYLYFKFDSIRTKGSAEDDRGDIKTYKVFDDSNKEVGLIDIEVDSIDRPTTLHFIAVGTFSQKNKGDKASPQFKGLGTRIIRALTASTRDGTLLVENTIPSAVKFYEKLGAIWEGPKNNGKAYITEDALIESAEYRARLKDAKKTASRERPEENVGGRDTSIGVDRLDDESPQERLSVAPRLPLNEREQSTAKPSAKPNKNPAKQKFLPGEISLRDPIGQFLVITGSDIRAVPDHLASVVRSISQYNAFPTSNDPDKMLRNMHETIVGNLVWLYDLIPENIRDRAKLWYDGANRIATQMSDKYGYTPEQTAGVYAALSPQKDWFMNVSLGDRVIAIFKERQNEMVSLPMKAWVDSYVKGSTTKADRIKRQEYAAKLRMLGNKRLKDMNDKEAALFIRTFDETYNPRQYRIITPEGGFLGFVTNNETDESDTESDVVKEGHVAWGSLNTIQKSVSVLRDGSKKNISDQLGDMHKVRNFYNNILVPGSRAGHVTIDTHAVAAAFFKALSGASEEVSNNFGMAVSKNLVPEGRERFGPGGSNITGASGTYGFIADAYRDAASRVAERDNIDLLPREMQSITWEAIRAIFPAAWKRENASRVEDIYNRAKSGEITLDAARDEVKALASTKSGGKLINEFAWEQATEGKFVKDGGTSFDQNIDPIVAKRKARLIEPHIIRDKVRVNLSAATTSEQLPGVAAIYADAKAGSVAARRLLQEYAQDNLNHLLSGIEGMKVSFNGAIGLYNKETEPALSMSVSFPEEQRDKALAALNKFSTNFNQERFDVREKTNKDVGHVFDDGSYATAAVYFKIKSALNDDQVQELIDGSGLAGLTFGKDFVEAYYVAENLEKAADYNEYKKFDQSIGRLTELLGQNAGKVETQVQRIWPYGHIGTGYGVTVESRNLGSYVPESSQVNNKTIKRVADYLNNKYRLTLTEEQQKKVPKTLKSFSPEKKLDPQQDALQSMIARFMDLLPNNNLKNQLVVKGYKNLSQALLEQYKAMPIKVEINAKFQDKKLVVLPDKYENTASIMRKDIQDNNHLYIYPTTKETFGPEGEDFSKHPLLAQSGLNDSNGYPLLYNDLLRAVHDYYAHGISEGTFGPLGEEAAWKMHMAMTPDPLARWALTMETRAQNSWVNFRENLDRSTPLKDRQFSPQKASFLPIEFALTGTPAIDASMKQYIETLTPVERLGSPVKDKASFNRLLQEHRKNKTDGKYPKYSIAAQQITSGKYSHAMQYPGMLKANWPLVPETNFYRENPDRDDIAIYKGKFIQLPWGDDKKSFGMDHILHNAIRQSNRRWEQVTDKDDENAILGIIDILSAKDLKVFKESPLDNKIIIRSGKFKRAIILGENKDDLRIISVVPSEMPKFGKIIDQTPDVKMSNEVLYQYKNNFTGIKVNFRFETPPATVTIKKTRSYELPKQSVAPRLNLSPYFGATGALRGNAIPTTFAAPASSKLTDHIYTWADKFVDLKNLQKEIEATIGQLEDQYNAYQKEELYHRKVAKQNLDFMRQEVRPLLDAMEKENITSEQLNDYVHNRHAEERNDQIDKINKGLVQGLVGRGSGISTQDANTYLNSLTTQEKASLDRVARMLDGIMKDTRALMVSSGLEEQGTIDAWERTYTNYVPLERVLGDPDEENTGFTGQGQGFSVSKNVKRALGSTLDVEHIIANILATRERTIVRAEKNEVNKALYGLALKAPNPNIWIAVDPELPRNKRKNLASILATFGGFTINEAKNIAAFPQTRSIDRQTGHITKGRNPQLAKADNVLHLMIDGKEKLLFFNSRNQQANRLIRTLKNLDTANFARGLQTVGAITRYFSAVNTQYNPIFGVVNLIRDVQSGLINLESTPIAGMQKQVASDFMPAIKGIWSQLRAEAKGGNGTGPWAALFKEFEAYGGPTGYRDMFANAGDRAKMIESEIKALNRGKIKSGFVGIGNMLSDYNTAFENGVRLAAYKAAIDKGLSKEKAASLAKNLTVNFNRKGDIGLQAGALYAFFNASVQGTARILQTMTKIENGKIVITPLGNKIIRGGLLLGVVQAVALAAAGFDDDNPPQFVREKNFVIPLMNGKYLTVPMPLGFNLLPNLSRNVTEWGMSGFKNTPKRITSLLESVMTGLNPFGGGFSVQTLVPTVVDPLMALAENRDSFGRKIYREDFSSLRQTPGYLRTKDTATPWSKGLSEFLNYASGGTQHMKGAFSPTPDQIDYLIGQATGGVGREIGKISQTVSSTVTGEELPSTKIPLASRFYGDTEESVSQSNKYYTNLSRINAYAAEIKGRIEKPGTGTVSEFIKDVPEARLVPLATATYSSIQKIEKLKKEAINRNLPKERIRQLEKLAQDRMKQFNQRVSAFQQ